MGAKVRDTKTKYNGVPIGFLIADKGHSGYPSGSVTLVTDKIITLKCFDAKESGGNNDRVNYGNNRYILSNIRQWLNKSGTGWFTAQTRHHPTPTSGATTTSTTRSLVS